MYQEIFINNPLGPSDFERDPEFNRQIHTYAQTVDAGRYLQSSYRSPDVIKAKEKMKDDKERLTDYSSLTKAVVQATKTYNIDGSQANRDALNSAKTELDDLGWMSDMLELRFAQDSKEEYTRAQLRCEQEVIRVAKIKAHIFSMVDGMLQNQVEIAYSAKTLQQNGAANINAPTLLVTAADRIRNVMIYLDQAMKGNLTTQRNILKCCLRILLFLE